MVATTDDINMVRFLLSMNAEIEQCSSTRQTPLHLAVLCGHLAIADLLLEKGADLQVPGLRNDVCHYGRVSVLVLVSCAMHASSQKDIKKNCLNHRTSLSIYLWCLIIQTKIEPH